jgi:hypothetical protein
MGDDWLIAPRVQTLDIGKISLSEEKRELTSLELLQSYAPRSPSQLEFLTL